MKPKFEKGDEVRLIVDCQTLYIVEHVKNINGAYFYDLIELKSPNHMPDVSESKIEAA